MLLNYPFILVPIVFLFFILGLSLASLIRIIANLAEIFLPLTHLD
jgi:hypothetical protein